MIVKALFASNVDELYRADELGIECEEKTYWDDFMFNLNDVRAAWMNRSGWINIYLEGIEDHEWTIKYDEKIWNKLKERFEE